MRIFLIIILIIISMLVGNLATAGANDPERPQPSPQDIRHWTREILQAHHLMASPRYLNRLQGVRILTALPDQAEPLIIERLPRLSLRVRLHTLEALVTRKSKEAARLIVSEALTGRYYQSRLITLLQHTPDGWLTLNNKLKALQEKDIEDRHPALEKFYVDFIEKEVRDHFVFCWKTYENGYFRVMFDRCWRYGETGFRTLVTIVKGEAGYLRYHLEKGRILASQALIDWPLEAEKKKQILGELVTELVLQKTTNWLGSKGRTYSLTNVRYALHQLGVPQVEVKDLLQQRLSTVRTNIQLAQYSSAVWGYNQIAEIYLSLRDDTKAAEYFIKALTQYTKAGNPTSRRNTIALVWYNLACLHSLKGEIESAVTALKESLDEGYTNFEWMWMDRDLEAIWPSDVFKNWIAELKTQEAWKHHIPPYDPGTLPE